MGVRAGLRPALMVLHHTARPPHPPPRSVPLQVQHILHHALPPRPRMRRFGNAPLRRHQPRPRRTHRPAPRALAHQRNGHSARLRSVPPQQLRDGRGHVGRGGVHGVGSEGARDGGGDHVVWDRSGGGVAVFGSNGVAVSGGGGGVGAVHAQGCGGGGGGAVYGWGDEGICRAGEFAAG